MSTAVSRPPAAAPRQRPLGLLVAILALAWVGAMAVDAVLDGRVAGELEAVAAQRLELAAGKPRDGREASARREAAASPSTQPAPRAAERRASVAPSPAAPRPGNTSGRRETSQAPRAVSASHSWYEGAAGYLDAFEEAERENKAVLVYFYTDWCPYCRKLDRDVLNRAQVEATTKFFVKIRVNPEDGQAEDLLRARYGVRSYPSLFVHPAGSNRPVKIRRSGSPADFAARLSRTAGERFTAG